MIKIDKRLARKMYYQGHTVSLIPSKCDINNCEDRKDISMMCVTDPITLSVSFDIQVDDYDRYSCVGKTKGGNPNFYVTEESMEQYNMCKMLCD